MRLVWLLATLGVLTVIGVSAIVVWVDEEVRSAHARVEAFNDHARTVLDGYRSATTSAGDAAMAALNQTPASASEAGKSSDVAFWADSGDAPPVALARLELGESIDELRTVAATCEVWGQVARDARAATTEARKTVAAHLTEAMAVISSAEGRERLVQLKQLAALRSDALEDPRTVATTVVDNLRKSSHHAAVRVELRDFPMLAERFVAAESASEMADVKDNQLRPTVERLTRELKKSKAGNREFAEQLEPVIAELLDDLLGRGHEDDEAHQTIRMGTGGLYGAVADRIESRAEQQRLFQVAGTSVDRCRAATDRLRDLFMQQAATLTGTVEREVADVRRTALLGASIASVLFLALAFRVAKAIRGQLQAILQATEARDVANEQLRKEMKERAQMEIELRQVQKLESVGRLASGIAHEINTPIQFVSDSIHFVRDSVRDLTGLIDKLRVVERSVLDGAPAGDAAANAAAAADEADLPYLVENLPKALDRSLDGLQRVSTIVRSMKEFAHPDQKEMAALDLNQAIRSTLTIARNEYKYLADVETDLSEIPAVTCHAGDVNQVVLNIVVNAAHAIGDVVKGTDLKGRITVRTRKQDDSVVISIADTGGGIPEAIRHRIFDPFFTTKEVGKGTGQGLAIARSVVDKHGGELTFETEMGKGTTFFIRLPIEGAKRVLEEAVA